MIGDTDKQTQFNKSVYSPLKRTRSFVKRTRSFKKDLELFKNSKVFSEWQWAQQQIRHP